MPVGASWKKAGEETTNPWALMPLSKQVEREMQGSSEAAFTSDMPKQYCTAQSCDGPKLFGCDWVRHQAESVGHGGVKW